MGNYKAKVPKRNHATKQKYTGNTKHYKAKITSSNMKINQEEKEALGRLLIFATTLDDNINENEAKRTIAVISKWATKQSKDIKTIKDLETLKNQEWAKEHLSDCIAIMVNILADSYFFDNQETNQNILEKYSNDFRNKVPEAKEEEINRITFSSKDYAGQFYGINRQTEASKAEKYANLMYLTNQLSHVFEETNNTSITSMSHYTIGHITNELRKIKVWCIHKLIEEKSKGEPIDIAVGEDLKVKSSFNGIISFAIPNYMEPFIIHYNPSILSEEELKLCDGNERYISMGLKTTFPQYLPDEKMALLQKLYAFSGPARPDSQYNRELKLEWLFDTKKILDRSIKRKLKNSPSKEETKKTALKPQIVDVQKENAETLKAIQSNLCISFPDYFKEGFLKRTSYSLAKYMQIVSQEVKESLIEKGIPQGEVDKEFAKLIVYMKMVKPLSTIYLKSKDEKVGQTLECLDEYGPIYDQIASNLESNNSYSELRSKIRKQANQITINKANPDIDELEINEKPPKENEGVKLISLPEETVRKMQEELISLNQEIETIVIALGKASKHLKSLQGTIAEFQEQIDKELHSDNKTNEEKGDR